MKFYARLNLRKLNDIILRHNQDITVIFKITQDYFIQLRLPDNITIKLFNSGKCDFAANSDKKISIGFEFIKNIFRDHGDSFIKSLNTRT